ncbi:Signal transduction histidine kinase [Azospirillum lipoferum]|nr:Signal transduction histidine kinase [Azospirillum lipoferum]
MVRRPVRPLALAAVLVGLAWPGVAAAATSGGVLFVSSFSPTVRWTEAMLATVNAELAGRDRPINLYAEFLDRSRLPDQPDAAEWAAFLASKYRDVRPGAIIADGAPAITLMADLGPRLFGGAPLIGIFPDFNDLPEAAARATTMRVTTGPHVDRTVDMALDQWPEASRLVIVSDDSGPSHHLAGIIRAAVAQRAARQPDRGPDRGPGRAIEVRHLHDHRIEDLESALAALPSDSVVLYTHLSVDALDRHFQPEQAAARMAKASAVPVYALFEPDIGSGVVGGAVNDPRAAGRLAIQAALELLDGTWRPPAADEAPYSSGPMVDWRALERWGIRETALPPGTEIRHRPPSLFEAHFAEALAGLVFIGMLSAALALISVLFVQRGRLARALRDANSRLEERVAARTRDIERALTGEREARQRLRTFLDMATHEFKTPLAVIDSAAQMLEMLVDTAKEGVGRRLTLIRSSARRVSDLVETCLAGERIDEELPVRFAPFDPAALIGRVAERQRGHGAIVRVADSAGLPALWTADADLLGIALDALLDNARRYGGEGEAIGLEAGRDGGALVFAVADRGPGIPEEERERVFEKYYRGSATRDKPGTGIGLNLVRTIAELHGGSVFHRPRDGGGSLFILVLPPADAVPPERRAGRPSGA